MPSFFDKNDQLKSVSFARPLFYSGEAILNSSMNLLVSLTKERLKYYDANKDEPEELNKHITFLGRLENVIHKHVIYNLSIDEAVYVGLIK